MMSNVGGPRPFAGLGTVYREKKQLLEVRKSETVCNVRLPSSDQNVFKKKHAAR